jgi:hypothetical protein
MYVSSVPGSSHFCREASPHSYRIAMSGRRLPRPAGPRNGLPYTDVALTHSLSRWERVRVYALNRCLAIGGEMRKKTQSCHELNG